MNKVELINKIAEMQDIPKKTATENFDMVIEAVKEGLIETGKIDIHGFGKLEVRDVAARQALNPKTGEVINVPAKRSVKFKTGKVLKDAVNG